MRCCRSVFGVVCVASSLLSSLAMAQAPADIARNIKESASVDAHLQTIETFISQHIQNLADSENPTTQSESRKALIAGVIVGENVKASPAYMDVYARTINSALEKLAKDDDVRTRMNAAIVTAQVAEQADNVQLRGAATLFIKDENPAVAWWGVKAAKWIIPPLLRNPGIDNNLIKLIIPTIEKHKSGLMVQEAYDALTLNFMNNNRNLNAQLVGAVVPYMLELLELRIKLYVAGIPEDPRADERPTLFLANDKVWSVLTPQLQTRGMQAMSDLLALASQQAANANQDQREPITKLIQQTAKAMYVIADGLGASGLTAALTPATTVDSRTPASQIPGIVAPVHPAVVAVKNFGTIQPASRLQSAGPATTNSAR